MRNLGLNITRDIYENYMVCWKERFPLFDDVDYELDSRHYRMILPCSSKEEAEQKMSFIQSAVALNIRNSGNTLYHLRDHYTRKEYRQMSPFVFYEDSYKAFIVEVHNSN